MSNRSRNSSRRARPSSGNANRQSVHSGRNVIPQNEVKKRVGNYVIGNTVGEGTFGKVRCAVHIPTGEKVAVKILEKKRIKEQADVRRVNREIKILKKARHGNIVQLYEVLDTPNSIYLIMEHADGGEMFDYIVKHKHVNEKQACKFFHQILHGVESLHKSEITHRDLKPENLLLKSSPQGWVIKIVDFGLSNTHDGGCLLSTACGSPCYAAPEMIAGKKYKGPGADTWSLGVILFALVCGYLPFEDPNTSNLYRKILSGEYKTPKWISTEVKDLIRKILETKPEKRLTIPQIREHVWMRSVPQHEIPSTELCDDEEATFVKSIVTKKLAEDNVDVQAVMDAVSSYACNSLSANYFLMSQKELSKYRERKKNGERISCDNLKNIPSNRTEISQVSSSSKPESSCVSEKQQPNVNALAPIISLNTAPVNEETDPSRMVPLVSPHRVHNPTEPVILNKVPEQGKKIPKLDLGKTQELRIDGTLQSQSARPTHQSSSPKGQKGSKNKNTVSPLQVDVVQSARPVLYKDSSTGNKENQDATQGGQRTEVALGGTLADFFPKDLSPEKNDHANPSNYEVTDDRPSTRRSKSRRGDGDGNIAVDGPGTGKIEYEDTKKLTDRNMKPLPDMSAGINIDEKVTLQPVVPSQPQRSNISSRGSNRRGRNITGVDIPLNTRHVEPLQRPPSGNRGGSRNGSFRQQKLQHKHQPHKGHTKNTDTKKSFQANGGYSKTVAREMAQENKQRQHAGYNIISGSSK